MVQAGREAQNFVARRARRWLDGGNPGTPGGERAGLVEEQCAHPCQRLQRAAPLHQHAAPGTARQAGDDRHRHTQDQRAWCGNHHDGEATHGITAPGPGAPGEGERERGKQEGGPIREPGGRCLRLLRLPNEPDDARKCAVRGTRRGDHVERRARVHRTAAHRRTCLARDRNGLAGQRQLVQDRGLVPHDPVHGHGIPGPHQQAVAGGDKVERDGGDLAVLVAAGGARDTREQGRHLASRPCFGEVLKRAAAREHDRDHAGGDIFIEREGAADRKERDDIETQLSPPQTGRAVQQDGREHRDSPSQHQPRGPVGPAEPARA